MSVSKNTVVDISIQILNREGIEGLSMRAIAHALHIKAASLYNHIRSKQDLFGMIMEQLCMSIVMPEDNLPPIDYLTASHRAYRHMLLTVRDSTVIAENSLPITPKRIEIIRSISQKLLEFGVLPENLMTVANMLNNYVLSFTADELRIKNASPVMLQEFADLLAPDDQVMFISDRDFDEQFDYGLQIIFSGLRNS